MGSSTEASMLAALEQAEMAARERRLAASSEAEAVLSAAQARASEIGASAGRRVDDALADLRHSAEAAADAAIVDLERVAAKRAGASTSRARDDRVVGSAVAMVVARVLGELSSDPDDGDRA